MTESLPTTSWRQQDGGAVGDEPARFTIYELAQTMRRCADKLEMRGNEEPRRVARILRETADHAGKV